MEFFSPNSNSTSGFFIQSKENSVNEPINGCTFKSANEPPTIETYKESLVPKFSNGFFKPDIFMGSKQEKKKRGRPRKIDPNLSFSDSSSNLSSIPPSPQSSNKDIFPQHGSNIDINTIISTSGSQYSPYTNTTSETADDLTLPSNETYEAMFKMINYQTQEAKSFFKGGSRGSLNGYDLPSTSKDITKGNRRKSTNNHINTPLISPNCASIEMRKKSDSVSQDGFKVMRRKNDSNTQPEHKLTEAEKKKLLIAKLDKHKSDQELNSKVPQIKSLTSYQLTSYMRKIRQKPQIQKNLSTELAEFVFEEPCFTSPSTSREPFTWDKQEENMIKDDDPEEYTDESSDNESTFNCGEISDQENWEFLQTRAKMIASDVKCMRRLQEVEVLLARKQFEMIKTEIECIEDRAESTQTCARCRPVPSTYLGRKRPKLVRQTHEPKKSSAVSNLIGLEKSLERHFIEHFWKNGHLSKEVVQQRKEVLQEICYGERAERSLAKFFRSDGEKKKKETKKKKPVTPTPSSPLKTSKQQLTKKSIVSSPIHKKLLKKSLNHKRKVIQKPPRPTFIRKSEGRALIDFFSKGWRLAPDLAKNRNLKNIALPTNEIHEALAKLANEAQYAEIFIPTWKEYDPIDINSAPGPMENEWKQCVEEKSHILFEIAREHHDLEFKERHWHASVAQNARLNDRRRSETENGQASTSTTSKSTKTLEIPPFEDSSTYQQLPNLLDDLTIPNYDRPSGIPPYEPRAYTVNNIWLAARYAGEKSGVRKKDSKDVYKNVEIFIKNDE